MLRNRMFVITIVFVFALLFLFIGQTLFRKENSVELNDEPINVVSTTLIPKNIILFDELPGRVLAYQRVEIRPQISGIIKKRLVEGGTLVKEGQVLFEIDPASLKADLETARAGLKRAQSVVEHARQSFKRTQILMKSNATSQQKYDDAQNDTTTAEANLAEAEAIFQRRQLDLDFATIKAPITGYIGLNLADEGTLAAPTNQTELAVVQDLARVYVDLRLSANKLDAVLLAAEKGLGPVEILNAQGKPYPNAAKLALADVVVDAGTGNATVRVQVKNENLQLLPGMFVRVKIPRSEVTNALLVPEEAIVQKDNNQAQIAVITKDNKAEWHTVTLGDRITNFVIITSGLKADERVIIQGQDRVQDGIYIQSEIDEQNTTSTTTTD